MFGVIARLLFGGEEKTPENVKSGEDVDDGWLVVNHQEVVSAEDQGVALPDNQTSPAVDGDTVSQQETGNSISNPEPPVESRNTTNRDVSGALSQPKALTAATQLACIQKAKAWLDRHHTSRNAIQRQNRVRQGIQQHSFHLQQPGHRSLGH